MKTETFAAITNVSICLAIGFTVWFIESAWPLLGLLFLFSVRGESDG